MKCSSRAKWSALGTIAIAVLVGFGAGSLLSPSAGGGHGVPLSGASSGLRPAVSPDLTGAASLATTAPALNESTLALSNNTLVPGDFVPRSSDLPSLEAYDPETNEIFVESFYAGVIDVLSGTSNRVVATIVTGEYPNTLAWDPWSNNICFGLQTYDEVSIANASTDLIQRTVGIGFEPLAMAADPVNGNLFVTGTNSTGAAWIAVLNGSSGALQDSFPFASSWFPIAGPNGIAYDPSNGEFYVPSIPIGNPSATRGNLTVIDASTMSIVRNISLRFEPSSILYAPSNGEFYLGNQSGNDLRVFDPVTGKSGRSIALPDTPMMLAYDSTANRILVGIEGNVSVVSTVSNRTIATFSVLRNPSGLAFDPVNNDVYVADYVWNNVSVVRASTYRVVANALLGTSPYNMAFDPVNGDLYVADLLSSQLVIVNGTDNRVVGFVPLGTTPYGIAYDPVTGSIYVDDYYAGNVSIVNTTTNRVVGYLPAGTETWGIAYDGANRDLYVTNPGSDNITVLDPATKKVVTSINLTTAPGAIAYDPKSSTMFVGEYDVGNVSVFNAKTNALIRNSTTGSEVYTIAVDPGTGHAFVGNYGSDNVTVLGPKGQELGISVAAGVGVFGSAYDPQDGDVYVVSFDSDLVTIINSTTATGVGGYTAGTGPVAVAVDPATGTVYVSNYDSDSLSLLSPTFRVATYAVTFREKGLPAGTEWSVRFDGVGLSSAVRTIVFDEPNGSGQPFAVAEVTGFSVNPEFGAVHVHGHDITVAVRFTRVTVAGPGSYDGPASAPTRW
jgi:YVTN family beta-propeller protein